MSETIKSFLTNDHRQCDLKFANMENAVASKNWEDAQKEFDIFAEDLRHHFSMEEDVLFPIFEDKTGMTCGPTKVMTMEHNQMLVVLDQMKDDVIKKDDKHFFGLSETLMLLLQQHNMKEEQMLYAMADSHLSDQVDEIIKKMKEL